MTGRGLAMACVIYNARTDSEQRVRDLGLTTEGLLSSVRAAAAAVAGCTSDSPPISRGWLAWYNAVVRLRQEFRTLGWDADDTANFSTIIDHAARIKIAVANTDAGTANVSFFPTNRSRRGELSRQAIAANQYILPLPGWGIEPDEAKTPGYSTWYLCLFIAGDTVRAELSLPTSCEGGYFGGWSERIFLASGEDDWAFVVPLDDSGPEFEVQISRK